MRVLADVANRLGESVLWHRPTGTIHWIDLLEPERLAYDVTTGQLSRHTFDLPAPLGALVQTTDPNVFVLAHRGGLAWLGNADSLLKPFVDPERGRDGVSYNDCKVDRFGRLWVGTSHIAELEPRGCLWCVTSNGTATLADAGFAVSNGPAFSPDGRTMYFSDSLARKILTYDIGPDTPQARNRRVFATFADQDGLPDGLTVDAEGCVWVAHWAGSQISRWSPDGERLESMAVPSVHVTALAFGGADMRTLHITTAREAADPLALQDLPHSGALFAYESGCEGIAETPFAAPERQV